MRIRTKDIEFADAVLVRTVPHKAAVERYVESFEALPPIVVYRITSGDYEGALLCADGLHRLAAADHLGLTEIDAEVRDGTLDEAAEFAILANTRHGEPFSRQERNAAIVRLKRLRPNRTKAELAAIFGVTAMTITTVIRAEEVREAAAAKAAAKVKSDSVLEEIGRAEPEHWPALVEQAADQGWSERATRDAVQNLKDEAFSAEHKAAILDGTEAPMHIDKQTGETSYDASVIGAGLKKAKRNDAYRAFGKVRAPLREMRRFEPIEVFDDLTRRDVELLSEEVERTIAYLEEILGLCRRNLKRLEVIS